MNNKGLTMSAGLLVLTEYIGGILKEDTIFYKKKNKQLLNNLLEHNATQLKELNRVTDLMLHDDRVRKIYEKMYEDETGNILEYDSSIILEDLSLINNLFRLFIRLYAVGTDQDLLELFIMLKAKNDKQKVLSGKEIDIFAKRLLEKFVNYSVEEKNIKEFIDNYGKCDKNS